MPKPKMQERMISTTITVPAELRERGRRYEEKVGTPWAKLARLAMTEYLDKHEARDDAR